MVYNINLKRARGPISLGIVFTLVGVLLLIIMGSIAISTMVKKNSFDAQTKAKNITWDEHYDSDDGTTYSPNYEYEVNGTIFVCKSTSSSNIKSGDGTVYYNSANPGECITDFDNNTNSLLFIFLILPIVFIVIGFWQIKKAVTKTKIAKELAKTGVLVKNLPYQLVNSNVSVNNVPLKCIYTTYKFPDGILREIKGEAINSNKLSDADGMCDLLYDPNNYDNYFIDFDITTTGIGNPTIVYYNQESTSNNISNGNNQNDSLINGYNPNNKF